MRIEVSAFTTLTFAAFALTACGTETDGREDTNASLETGLIEQIENEVAIRGDLQELTTEFPATDSLGNRYRVVVRYDESIATEVEHLRSGLQVISTIDGPTFGYNEELAALQVPFDVRAASERETGSYVILPYPVDNAPDSVGITIKRHVQIGGVEEGDSESEGQFSTQAAYETTSGNVDVNYCSGATSFQCYMSGALTTGGGSNSGSLRARRWTNASSCGGSLYTINSVSYTVNQTYWQYFNVSGYYAPSSAKQCRIDPNSPTDQIVGDLSLTVWW